MGVPDDLDPDLTKLTVSDVPQLARSRTVRLSPKLKVESERQQRKSVGTLPIRNTWTIAPPSVDSYQRIFD